MEDTGEEIDIVVVSVNGKFIFLKQNKIKIYKISSSKFDSSVYTSDDVIFVDKDIYNGAIKYNPKCDAKRDVKRENDVKYDTKRENDIKRKNDVKYEHDFKPGTEQNTKFDSKYDSKFKPDNPNHNLFCTESPHLTIYTDGTCTNNHNNDPTIDKYMGVGVYFEGSYKIESISKRITDSNNNNIRSEMYAIIEALNAIHELRTTEVIDIAIYSDCESVVNIINKPSRSVNRRSNRDLWDILFRLDESTKHNIKYYFIKRSSMEGNIIADRLARYSVGA